MNKNTYAPGPYMDKELINSAKVGDTKGVIKAIRDGANIWGAREEGSGYTALMGAIQFGKLETVKSLLEWGAAAVMEVETSNGTTALNCAASNACINGDRLEILRLLLRNGAQAKDKNKNGKTARDYACSEEVKVLLDKSDPLFLKLQEQKDVLGRKEVLNEIIKDLNSDTDPRGDI
ncbi:MAG: ankyrin repeat domain-containing protein [Candidatus Micrarchaeota archaeon]|nr:ankyrin repeat domain-containing protein [Candidatus Micrarchaeota archaeon]